MHMIQLVRGVSDTGLERLHQISAPTIAGAPSRCDDFRTGARHNRGPVRLNKYLSESGICSRREADALDRGGARHRQRRRRRARHAGQRGRRVVDGEPVAARAASPSTSRSTSRSASPARPSATSPATSSTSSTTRERIFPIGRLDKDSEGPDPAHQRRRHRQRGPARRARPREGVRRRRRPPVTDDFLARMARGVRLLDTTTKPCKVERIGREGVSHHADAGAEPADPPHVRGARLHRRSAAARAHHAHQARRAARSAAGANSRTRKWHRSSVYLRMPKSAEKASPQAFQDLILALQRYWAEQGCVLLQPYDMEVGAGTFHPATFLRALGPEPWNAAFVQSSRGPSDGRYGDNPFRRQHYFQFQVA